MRKKFFSFRPVSLIFLKSKCLLVLLLLPCFNSYSQPVDIKTEKIWDQAPHNAFTDLIQFRDAIYCTFREGSGHVPGTNGKIRILKSYDAKKWISAGLLEKDGYDLRDPGFAITAQGNLMVLMGGSVYENKKLLSRTCQVSFYDSSAETFSSPQPIKTDQGMKSDFNWLWRVKWQNNKAYGVVYDWQDTGSQISLVSSENGIDYSLVRTFDIGGRPNETALRFMSDGSLILLVRREDKNQNGLIGISKFPYQDWEWVDTGYKLGGPNFIITPAGKLIIGTRTYSKDGSHTGLLGTDESGKFRLLTEFPSGGDTSYPGMIIYKNKLIVSYYSSHEGKTSIYLAKIPMRDIKKVIGKNAALPFSTR